MREYKFKAWVKPVIENGEIIYSGYMIDVAEIEKLKAELSVNLNDLEWMTEQRDKLQAEVERLKAEQLKEGGKPCYERKGKN